MKNDMKKFLFHFVVMNLPLLAFGQVKSDGENSNMPATAKPVDAQVTHHNESLPKPIYTDGFDRFVPVELKADENRKPRVRENEEELLKQKAKGPGAKDRYQPVR